MQPEPATAADLESVLRHACDELRRRLLAGEDCRAEQFLAAYPSLASDPDAALTVIRAEWLARHDAGRQLPPEQWQARFPAWSDQFSSWLPGEAPPQHSTADGAVTVAVADSPTGPTTPTQSLDHHLLQEQIGQGGMGTVYRAWDPVLKRHVALKKIRAGVLADEGEVARFYREARAAAQLHHPNVVPIHGMGLHQGEHCFTMTLTPETLEKQKHRYQADVRAAVALVEAVARGVQAAHDKHIIHRDLKPANILLDGQGQPLVADFGLAKFSEAGAGDTLPGVIMGTAAYMSPEQAAGRTWEVGEASDVWALGVILYELLTGRHPFPGKTTGEVLRQVLETDPPRPRLVRPALDRPLEAILLRCLQRQPGRRYPTASALGDDLERWLHGVPIPPPLWPGPRGAVFRWSAMLILLAALMGGVLVATSSPPSRPPARLRPDLQQRLLRGEKVLLIGPTGRPPGGRWLGVHGALAGPLGKENTLTLNHGIALVLYELVPEQPLRRYRYRAEVRHVASTGRSRVGIFFGHGQWTRPQGTIEHFQWDFTFNDLPDAPRNVGLKLRHHRDPSERRGTNNTVGAPARPLRSRLRPGERPPWHRLAVEVDEQAVTTYFDGVQMQQWPRARWRKDVAALFDLLPPAAGNVPAWSRGGLGLFVYRGAASFRNVVLEPLPAGAAQAPAKP